MPICAPSRAHGFMSQIVDYDSTDLEKLSLYARHLYPLLRESRPEDDPIDLSSVELSHCRTSVLKQDLFLLGTASKVCIVRPTWAPGRRATEGGVPLSNHRPVERRVRVGQPDGER